MKNLFHKSSPLFFAALLTGSLFVQPADAQQRERGQQMTQEQREEMRERYQNLTPEQREAMRERRINRRSGEQMGTRQGVESWLSPEQREELKDLRLAVAEQRTTLKNQLNEAKARLKTVSTGATINEREAKELIESMAQLDADIKKLEWDLRMDVRAMLNEEQQIRFDQMPWPQMREAQKKAMQHGRMATKMKEYQHKKHHKYDSKHKKGSY